MTSKCFSLLLSASSLTLLSLYWSVSGMFGSCRSSRRMVYDWYELTSSSLTFCSIVLLVSLTLSMIRCAASSRLASSTSAYTQLMCFSFLRASLSAQMSMRLCQTTMFVFDFELTMINSSGLEAPLLHRQFSRLPLPTSSRSFQAAEVKRTLSLCKPSTSCG